MVDVVQPHIFLETHRTAKAYAALTGCDVPTAYKILVNAGLENLGVELSSNNKPAKI